MADGEVREAVTSGHQLSDAETLKATQLIEESGRKAVRTGNWADTVWMVIGWRRGGTETARALAMRRAMAQTPAERLQQAISLGMAAPKGRIGQAIDRIDGRIDDVRGKLTTRTTRLTGSRDWKTKQPD